MNRKSNLALVWVITILLVTAAVGVLSWQNYRYASTNKGGNDFLLQWMSTRTFLTQGSSPYSDETALKVQNFVYGRTAQSGEAPFRYVSPLYSILIYFPFALIADFAVARAAFMTVLEISILVIMFFSLRLTRWRPSVIELLLFVMFSLFWFHAVRPLLDGNSAILVTLFLVSGLLALKNGGDGLAGLMFALATIKPNIVFPAIVFILIWSIATSRWQLLSWLLGTLFLLSLASGLLLPDWIMQNFRELLRFPTYSQPSTIGAVLGVAFPAMAERIARLAYSILAGMMLVEWWWARHAEFRGFLFSVLFTLVVSQWVGIPTNPANFIILYPALVLVFSTWEERWHRAGRALSIVSMLLIFGGLWALYLTTTAPASPAGQNLLLFFPLPAFLILALYWVRWWAIRPPRMLYDFIDSRGNR